MAADILRRLCLVTLLFSTMIALPAVAEQRSGGTGVEVMQAFSDAEAQKNAADDIDDQTKRIVMFVMGVPLLLLLIATAAFGVAMGVYDKPVFVPHLVCAGLSLTLAAAHAVVGLVWFYPF